MRYFLAIFSTRQIFLKFIFFLNFFHIFAHSICSQSLLLLVENFVKKCPEKPLTLSFFWIIIEIAFE